MKAKYFAMVLCGLLLLFLAPDVMAQCSICSKTAAQLGPDAGKGLNAGILYLAAVPLSVCSFVGYKWWKMNQEAEENNE